VGVRKSIATLAAAELTDFRDAFAAVYDLHDDRGWAYHAGLHGLPLPGYCQHGTLQFLPWHRAYLYFFELALTDALRRVRGDQTLTVSLPWWDWTSAAAHADGLPAGYLADPGGGSNPLVAGPVTLSDDYLELIREDLPGAITDGQDPVTVRDPDVPDELPRTGTVARALRATTFSEFSALVESIHNGVHGWVGGAMSVVPIASYDPVFWAHHAMIDRLWYLWQISPHGTSPGADLLGQVLAPWPVTVSKVLDISTLGYEYAAQVIG
jgi:tyrosinase